MTHRIIRLGIAVGLLGFGACRSNLGAPDDRHAVGEYVRQAQRDSTALTVSGAITLNIDHTFREVESIRIVEGRTSDWSSRGTWTLNGKRLVKVHETPDGPVTELALLVGDTVKAGRTVLVRR